MRILALDVGEKRIGVAYADTSSVRIAVPREMIPVDGEEKAAIAKRFRIEQAKVLVSGYPRNSKGETTKQTEFVENFINSLMEYFDEIGQVKPAVFYQDESLTSVTAEANLLGKKRELSRKDRADGIVDSEAAAIFLQDFIETNNLTDLEQQINN